MVNAVTDDKSLWNEISLELDESISQSLDDVLVLIQVQEDSDA